MRLLAGIILFLSVLYLPAWLYILMVVSFAFLFNSYYEALFAGFLADSLYAPLGTFYNAYGVKYLLISAIILLLVEGLKRRLKYYSN
jgi:hypothetical protein